MGCSNWYLNHYQGKIHYFLFVRVHPLEFGHHLESRQTQPRTFDRPSRAVDAGLTGTFTYYMDEQD